LFLIPNFFFKDLTFRCVSFILMQSKASINKFSLFITNLEARSNHLMAFLYVLLSCISFSFVDLSIKLTHNAPSFQIMHLTTLVTVILCYFISQALHINLYLKQYSAYKYVDGRCFFGALSVASAYIAVRLIPLTESVVIGNLSPIWASIFCAIFLNEPFSKIDYFLAGSSFSGVLMIVKPDFLFANMSSSDESESAKKNTLISSDFRILGIVLTVLLSFLKVFVGIFIRKLNKIVHFNPIFLVFYFFVWCSLFSSFVCIILQVKALMFFDMFVGLIAGFFNTFGHVCYARAFQLEEVGQIMLLNYMQCVFNFLIDVFVLKTYLDAFSIIGCMTILVSLIILVKKKK